MPRANDPKASAHPAKRDEPACHKFMQGKCTNSSSEYWQLDECAEYRTNEGSKIFGQELFSTKRRTEQPGKETSKDTKPDKATTALVTDIEKLGFLSRITELLREPTDGSTDASSNDSILQKRGEFFKPENGKGPSLGIIIQGGPGNDRHPPCHCV